MKTANTTYRYYNFVHILYLRNECLSVFCFSLPLRAIVFLCYFFFLSFFLWICVFFFRCFSFTFFLGYEMICCCGCLSSTSCCRFLLLFFFYVQFLLWWILCRTETCLIILILKWQTCCFCSFIWVAFISLFSLFYFIVNFSRIFFSFSLFLVRYFAVDYRFVITICSYTESICISLLL